MGSIFSFLAQHLVVTWVDFVLLSLSNYLLVDGLQGFIFYCEVKLYGRAMIVPMIYNSGTMRTMMDIRGFLMILGCSTEH